MSLAMTRSLRQSSHKSHAFACAARFSFVTPTHAGARRHGTLRPIGLRGDPHVRRGQTLDVEALTCVAVAGAPTTEAGRRVAMLR